MQQHYTMDNTDGFPQEQLDAWNAELDALLTGLEPHTDQWYAVIKRHADDVARR